MVDFPSTFIPLAAAALGLVQAVLARQVAPRSNGGVCSDNLKKTDIPLWVGAPRRQDSAREPNSKEPWWKEVSAVTNSIMGLKVLVDGDDSKGKWDYIPRVIFGAPNEYTNFDKHQLGEDNASKAAPVIRQDEVTKKGVVNLNLFPLSDKPMVVCVQFDLPETTEVRSNARRSDGDTVTAPDPDAPTQVVWYRALQAAMTDEGVKARLQKKFGEYGIQPESSYATMAYMEMLTGIPTMFAWRKRTDVPQPPSPDPKAVVVLDDQQAMHDWLFKKGANGNWNPTVMKSIDTGIRVVRPQDGLIGITLEDSRALGPDFKQANEGDREAVDRDRTDQELWGDGGAPDSFKWAVRLLSWAKGHPCFAR